ncbi:hypothetical protein CSUB01_12391 [Colletotrichum sublineola]|uniref:Uncharacterized protein n=1 Tax=Colletotrichum sublineola TaxID=1173701 RepID=A0A066XWN2_COLSU|nr:hypothetical protein CSUB01_12391 [Colletotrichum sublineola]
MGSINRRVESWHCIHQPKSQIRPTPRCPQRSEPGCLEFIRPEVIIIRGSCWLANLDLPLILEESVTEVAEESGVFCISFAALATLWYRFCSFEPGLSLDVVDFFYELRRTRSSTSHPEGGSIKKPGSQAIKGAQSSRYPSPAR